MTIVVPAWDIKRVLDIPKFAEARRPGEEELQRTVAKMIEDDGKASKDGRTRG
jgi:hypothetical protein